MFGYIKAFQPQLRVCEMETYNAVYCALCKQMGKRFGIFSRLLLSYDFTFLAMLQIALGGTQPSYEKKRCFFNPCKRKICCVNCKADLNFSASTAILMVYQKVRDNLHDGSVKGKLIAAVMYPFITLAKRKAARDFPEMNREMEAMTLAQRNAESAGTCDFDVAADPTAKALAAVFSACAGSEGDKRILTRLGYCMGKWIYLLDAADDIEKDYKHHDFNVITNRYRMGQHDVLNNIEEILNQCIKEALSAYRLLNIKRYDGIFENIFLLGMPSSQRQVFDSLKGKEVFS